MSAITSTNPVTLDPETEKKVAIISEGLQQARNELNAGGIRFLSAYDALPSIAVNNKLGGMPTIKFEMNGHKYTLWKSNRDHFELKRLEKHSDWANFDNPLKFDFGAYSNGSIFNVLIRDKNDNKESAILSEFRDPVLDKEAKELEMDILKALLRSGTMPKGLIPQVNLIA